MSDLVFRKRPPEPLRESERLRQGLSVRVDAGLIQALHEACKKHNLKWGELMEIILWNALGEPPMSYEPGFWDQEENRKED
jgi:hypothetical protein